MDPFDYWLFMVPWRLERFYDMVPSWPMDDAERTALIRQYDGG